MPCPFQLSLSFHLSISAKDEVIVLRSDAGTIILNLHTEVFSFPIAPDFKTRASEAKRIFYQVADNLSELCFVLDDFQILDLRSDREIHPGTSQKVQRFVFTAILLKLFKQPTFHEVKRVQETSIDTFFG